MTTYFTLPSLHLFSNTHSSYSISEVRKTLVPYIEFASLQATHSIQWLANKKWEIIGVVAGLLLGKVLASLYKRIFGHNNEDLQSETQILNPLNIGALLSDNASGTLPSSPSSSPQLPFTEQESVPPPISLAVDFSRTTSLSGATETKKTFSQELNEAMKEMATSPTAIGALTGALIGVSLNALIYQNCFEDSSWAGKEEGAPHPQLYNYLFTATLFMIGGMSLGCAAAEKIKILMELQRQNLNRATNA